MRDKGHGNGWRLGSIAVVCSLLVLAGCASHAPVNAKQAVPNGQAAAITVVDASGRTIALAQPPERVVALGNGEVDIVYALGGEVVGRPTVSGDPAVKKAEAAMEIGSVHTVDLEKLALLRPDVVLGNYPLNAKDVAAIAGIGAELVLSEANTIAQVQQQILQIGQLLGKEQQAARLKDELDQQLADLAQAANDRLAASEVAPRVLLIYGAPGTYLAALPTSLGGDLLKAAGGVNIAEDYPRLQSYPQYAQLSTERIVEADPAFILIMTHGDAAAVKEGFLQEMQTSSAWNSITAVREGNVHVLPADLFGTNPGTRIGEALQMLQELLYEQELRHDE